MSPAEPGSPPCRKLFSPKASPLNFKKLMLIVVPLLIVIFGYQFLTRVDRTDPVKVATAFTKALKSGNTSKASGYYVPEEAESWRDGIDGMKSGQTTRYIDSVPSDPAFTPPVTSKAGLTTVQSADKTYTLQMKQIDGKWYVSKAG